MKQFSLLLIVLFCSLSAFGQQDSGRNPVRSSSQRRDTQVHKPTIAVQKLNGNKKDSPKLDLEKRESINTQSAIGQHNSDSDRTAVTTATANKQKVSKDTLSAEQKKEAEAEAYKQALLKRRDSIAAAQHDAVISRLKASALRASSLSTYDNYFPEYFYENNLQSGRNALVAIHAYNNRDLLFYAFMGIAFLLGITKILFPRYFNQVFWFFLHPSDRKNNAAEQLQGQNILPSLLLNLLFVLTGGLFLTLIMNLPLWGEQFWKSWAVFSCLLAGIYFLKYLVILLSGWLFGAPIASNIYNQVVFSINKIIGLVLLPTTMLMSYGSVSTSNHVLSTVTVIIGVLLLYRYIASFLLIKGKLKVSAFHFILYLCAVEIVPLLLVYKVLLTNMGRFV